MSHLLVVCAKRYNGHELWTLLGVIKKRGHSFEVVSQENIIRDEMTLRPNTLERTVYELETPMAAIAFAGVCFVSGNMKDTESYWKDQFIQGLVEDFHDEGKILAAICCSTPILAPVCAGVRVSFYPLIRVRHIFQLADAILQNTSMTIDGNIITAENQMMTEMWAEEICNRLEGKPVEYEMVDCGFIPQGTERRMLPEVRAAIDEDRGYKMVLEKDIVTGRKL